MLACTAQGIVNKAAFLSSRGETLKMSCSLLWVRLTPWPGAQDVPIALVAFNIKATISSITTTIFTLQPCPVSLLNFYYETPVIFISYQTSLSDV